MGYLVFQYLLHLILQFKITPFQFLWYGLVISIFGNHLNKIGLIWFVNDHFHGSTGATALSISNTLPVAIVAIFAGVLADRFNRTALLYIGDLTQAFIVFIMFSLFTFSTPNLFEITLLSALSGMFGLLYYPSSQSLIPDIADKDQSKVVKMNSWILGTSTTLGVLGPAIAGNLVKVISVNWLLFLNALSFVFSFLMTWVMVKKIKKAGINTEVPAPKNKNFFKDAKDGFKYIFTHPVLGPLFTTFAILDATTNALPYLLPQIISDDIGADAGIFGTALAVGMISRVIAMAVFNKTSLPKYRGFVFCANLFIQGIGVLTIAEANAVWMIFLGYILLGIPSGMTMTSLSSYIQLETPKELRGRIFSSLTSITTCLKPVWMLILAGISHSSGVQGSFLYASIALLLGGIIVSSRPAIRNIK